MGLECTKCGRRYPSNEPHELCPSCEGILDPVYDLDELANAITKSQISKRPNTMWKWHEFLPVSKPSRIVTANEGGTPLIKARRLGERLGVGNLYIKDETKNPTGTFKDRGASSTISKLTEIGMKKIGLSSEGNAGCSFALYAQMADIECHVYTPSDAAQSKRALAESLGAKVKLVKGTIMEAGARLKGERQSLAIYNCSTFVTPYRHDGKATMALEACEQLGWISPDLVIYPVGGGVGIVGMWKAFKALKRLDWLKRSPRMIGVQPFGCAPVVKAFKDGRKSVERWKNPRTVASGLKVPQPLAGRLILRAIYESKGYAVAVKERDIVEAMKLALKLEGLILEPSSAAALASIPYLLNDGQLDSDELIVAIATGSGLKTIEELQRLAPLKVSPT